MSYDVSLWVPQEVDVLDWNYTSNCSPMWREAGADLAEFHGKTARECLPFVYRAIAKMKAEPEKYDAMNPPNGWGSRESLVEALEGMAMVLEQHPDGKITVSR